MENRTILTLTIAGMFSALYPFFFSGKDQAGMDDRLPQGMVKYEFVFDKAPFAECHASTLAETDKGLVVAWFGGTREKDPNVGIWVSRNNGGGWTVPVEVADGIQNDTLRYPCWNPVLFNPEHGALMLFYKVGPDPGHWWGMLIRSDDGGRTWSNPEKLPRGMLGPVKNKPLLLQDGTLLCGSSTENDGWKVHLERTLDHGASWEKVIPVADPLGLQPIQPTLLRHPGDTLQMLCRTRKGVVAQSWSFDNGLTWSALQATALPNPNSGIDAVTLKDDRQLLVYNHVSVPEGKWGGPRSPLNVAVSDDGKHWKAAMVLEDKPGEYSYPAVIQTKDGKVHITYTWKRKKIKHVVLDTEKLPLLELSIWK